MNALYASPIQEKQTISTRHSTDGGKTWTTTKMTVPVYTVPLQLIIGGCFGADLPFSVNTDGGDLRVRRPAVAETKDPQR